jgi:hypothetical protein
MDTAAIYALSRYRNCGWGRKAGGRILYVSSEQLLANVVSQSLELDGLTPHDR